MSSLAYPFPRIPYDEVESSFIRDEIRRGEFVDPEYRTYVNCLIKVEWYATGGLSPNVTGLSAAGAAHSHWRIATKYPEAYDAVRRECDADTRAETTIRNRTETDPTERQRWAHRHHEEWQAVLEDRGPELTGPVANASVADRPTLADPFRFPEFPYDDVRSEFVREELKRGSFDDMEHRRYVNRLVYFEAFARDDRQVIRGTYPPVRPWQVAAKHPIAYDRLQLAFDEETRAELVLINAAYPSDDLDERRRRHVREWRRVQEHDDTDGSL